MSPDSSTHYLLHRLRRFCVVVVLAVIVGVFVAGVGPGGDDVRVRDAAVAVGVGREAAWKKRGAKR